MASELIHRTVHANGIDQHFVEAGEGPPVILLHGFPLFWFQWRKMIPALAERYRVIAPDLRGYGATDKPETGYDKRTMANDIRALMTELGIERAAIVGHDRGARVGTRFVKDHPHAVSKFVTMDNIPTRTVGEQMNSKIAKAYWFFSFNTVPDLPEALIAGREDIWLRYFFRSWSYDPDTITGADFETYVENYRQPGAVHGALNDYRAGEIDTQQDNADADVKIAHPTLVLWGEESVAVNGLFDIRRVWREMAVDPQFVTVPQCSHLPPEEQPDAVNDALFAFLKDWKG